MTLPSNTLYYSFASISAKFFVLFIVTIVLGTNLALWRKPFVNTNQLIVIPNYKVSLQYIPLLPSESYARIFKQKRTVTHFEQRRARGNAKLSKRCASINWFDQNRFATTFDTASTGAAACSLLSLREPFRPLTSFIVMFTPIKCSLLSVHFIHLRSNQLSTLKRLHRKKTPYIDIVVNFLFVNSEFYKLSGIF